MPYYIHILTDYETDQSLIYSSEDREKAEG